MGISVSPNDAGTEWGPQSPTGAAQSPLLNGGYVPLYSTPPNGVYPGTYTVSPLTTAGALGFPDPNPSLTAALHRILEFLPRFWLTKKIFAQ